MMLHEQDMSLSIRHWCQINGIMPLKSVSGVATIPSVDDNEEALQVEYKTELYEIELEVVILLPQY